MTARARLMRLLLTALLLMAQQTALVHAAWHAARATTTAHGQPAPGKAGKSDSGQARLCVFDAVFGQVLGGGACSAAFGAPHVPFDAIFVATAPACRCIERPASFHSRAPPAFL